MDLYFSNYFCVSEEALQNYGAFNISLVTDLPLFIDPFLLFNSSNEEYQMLHDSIIRYLRFLRSKSIAGNVPPALLKSWYNFSEVKQNWFGFCISGNTGRGLGKKFAQALDLNLQHIFSNFGQEKITKGSHLEKLCLIRSGVGRDMISDFTTNLIKGYLLNYTETFAVNHIHPSLRAKKSINKAAFSYKFERWMPKTYDLPVCKGDYVILTPKDILTKDETWINHQDLYIEFEDIPDAVENDVLRAEINNYFYSMIPEEPTKDDYGRAIDSTIRKFPELIDYFIKYKEDHGDEAVKASELKVVTSYQLYIKQFGELIHLLNKQTDFYNLIGDTEDETRKRIEFFKDVIENKGGHSIFYHKGEPISRESDAHILFRLTWYTTPSDVSREVNDGRGPADFKISRGSKDKTLVEFKLAKNTKLKRNLEKQLEIYKNASDAKVGFKVIIFFTEQEYIRVEGILDELKMVNDPYIYLVDARLDNKPSGSKA